jgi:hypothetical protein
MRPPSCSFMTDPSTGFLTSINSKPCVQIIVDDPRMSPNYRARSLLRAMRFRELSMKKLQLALLLLTVIFTTASLGQDARFNDLANLPFEQDYPTDRTAQGLTDELLFERGSRKRSFGLDKIAMHRSRGPLGASSQTLH